MKLAEALRRYQQGERPAPLNRGWWCVIDSDNVVCGVYGQGQFADARIHVTFSTRPAQLRAVYVTRDVGDQPQVGDVLQPNF
jgi:hypothetical protein